MSRHRDTELQHAGEDRQGQHGAASPPVYRSSLFTFADSATLERALRGADGSYVYSRVANPTVRVLEEKVTGLEGAHDCVAVASGMAAISSVLLAHVKAGAHLVISSKAYGPTLTFVRDVLEPLGVRVTLIDPRDVPDLSSHLRDETSLVYLESPSSLTFEVCDLEAAARVCRARGIVTATDNSWATPIGQQPAALGVDLVVHSGTKYIGGHSDIVFGLVAGTQDAVDRTRATSILLGGTLSPEDAFLAVRGLRTLALRMERHSRSALDIARRLLAEPRVVEVLHPAMPFFPSHDLWLRQFSGSSGLFSFLLDGDPRRFCDALELFSLGVSWGGHESLALPSPVLPEVAPSIGVRPDLPRNLVRLSIGLEDPEDLWEDLQRGFEAL